MNEIAVLDASPLIFLARGGHLGLLQRIYARNLVPVRVEAEIMARGPSDATVIAVRQSNWIEVQAEVSTPVEIERWGLGSGESAVLALGRALPDAEVVLDDLAARRCAHALCLQVRGTLGIILLAKKRRLIPLARPVLEDLVKSGMYLSGAVLDRALRMVGE